MTEYTEEIDELEDEQQPLYEHFRIVVDEGQSPLRIDKYMFEKLQHSSRNRIQQAADAGFVHVNDRPVKSNYKVRPNDVITLMLDRPRHDSTIEAEDIPLNIVYEDAELLVVDKPAGLVVHPGAGNFHGTLVNAVAWHLKDLPSYDPNDAKRKLGVQFFNKTTRRSYNALVWGHFAEDEGRIEGNIGRDPRDRLRMKVFDPVSGIGKPAVTHYRVLERFGYVTLIECMLETGRTHQIRAHLRHIGHPLFADERYGGTEILRGNRSSTYKSFIQNCFKLCNRQALHARTLGFRHPTTGREMDFCAPLPRDMEQLIDKWRAFITGTTIDTYDN